MNWENIGIILVIPIFFCMIIELKATNLKIAIVNHETNYTNISYQDCPHPSGCRFSGLSCRFLANLNNDTMHKSYYPNVKSAIDAVRNGDVSSALYTSENFTDAFVARLALKEDSDQETLDQSEIRIWLNVSDKQIETILHESFEQSYLSFTEELVTSCDSDIEIGDTVLSFKNVFSFKNI